MAVPGVSCLASSLSERFSDLLHVSKVLEGLKTWLRSMNDASASRCRRGRGAREARRGASLRQSYCAPSVWSDRRHIRPAGVLLSLFRVAHSHPDHNVV